MPTALLVTSVVNTIQIGSLYALMKTASSLLRRLPAARLARSRATISIA